MTWSVVYPFPLDAERVADLRLPRDGLTATEAARLRDFVDSLVIPKPEPNGGGQSEGERNERA